MEEDHSSHIQKFLDDSIDLVDRWEQLLLEMEKSPNNKVLAEEAFRAIHTIKGAANMFGFEVIGELTHKVEDLYDLLRSGDIDVGGDFISLSFQATDLVKALLNIQAEELDDLDDKQKEQLSKLYSDLGDYDSVERAIEETGSEGLENTHYATYFIQVTPHESIAKGREHPYEFVIEELVELGKHVVESMRSDSGEQTWKVVLATDQGEETIRDVFIFVEGNCDILVKRLAKGNFFLADSFESNVKKILEEGGESLIQNLNELCNSTAIGQLSPSPSDKPSKSTLERKKQTQAQVRVGANKIDQLMNWVSELVTLHASLKATSLTNPQAGLETTVERMEFIVSELRETVFSMSLLPLNILSTRLHRQVRELSQRLDKRISLHLEGFDQELDKKIIDKLADPLMHIIQNCADHGIETAEERAKVGKPRDGYISIAAKNAGADIVLTVSDDGRGVNLERIRQKAVELGVSRAEELSKDELLNLLMEPGFSTAEQLTDISGRGVGMDVVRQKVEELRGSVSIDTVAGEGTEISVKVPLTLSVLQGILVEVGDENYIIPLHNVQGFHKIESSALNTADKINKSLEIEDKLMSFVELRDFFSITSERLAKSLLVIVSHNGQEKAIAIDKVLSDGFFVLKPLGQYYRKQDFISGATILGTGKLALIIDTNRLFAKLEKNITYE